MHYSGIPSPSGLWQNIGNMFHYLEKIYEMNQEACCVITGYLIQMDSCKPKAMYYEQCEY